jgi:hypothetical protein
MGGKGGCGWPGKVHQWLVPHRRLVFSYSAADRCRFYFRNGTQVSMVIGSTSSKP